VRAPIAERGKLKVMYVLGIDAGGTKTICYLADGEGRVVGEGRGGGANLQAHGELEVEKVLHAVVEVACGDRAILPAAVCLGIAGVDRPEDDRVVRGIMRRLGFRIPWSSTMRWWRWSRGWGISMASSSWPEPARSRTA
jgi:BadF/BadG/BcrA/BcrD ATPase family